jgi:hypothetical protein
MSVTRNKNKKSLLSLFFREISCHFSSIFSSCTCREKNLFSTMSEKLFHSRIQFLPHPRLAGAAAGVSPRIDDGRQRRARLLQSGRLLQDVLRQLHEGPLDVDVRLGGRLEKPATDMEIFDDKEILLMTMGARTDF